VRSADLRLPPAGVVGLLGPNGAGKTTTIRMIAGVLPPDEGELTVLGIDARRHGAKARELVGYLPESAPLYPELTVHEYLRFRAGIAGLSPSTARRAIDELSQRCDVARFAHRCCGALSKGMQQRVGVAATLLADPRIVILDEPSVGLDPGQTLAFRELVRQLGSTRLVVLSSHLLSEVESVCTELAVIAGGRVVAHESIDRFRARATSGARLFAETDRAIAGDAELRSICSGLSERMLDDGWYRIEFASGGDDLRPALATKLAARGIRMRALGSASASLESVFVEMVKRSASEGAA
jgi:ABC-2 type transport system ATP-binding protein